MTQVHDKMTQKEFSLKLCHLPLGHLIKNFLDYNNDRKQCQYQSRKIDTKCMRVTCAIISCT